MTQYHERALVPAGRLPEAHYRTTPSPAQSLHQPHRPSVPALSISPRDFATPTPPLDDLSRFDSTGSQHMPPQLQHEPSGLTISPPSPTPPLSMAATTSPTTILTPTLCTLLHNAMTSMCSFACMGAGLGRAYLVALFFRIETSLARCDVDITALTDEFQARLEVTFALNKEQAANIRLVAQDLIYSSHRTSYLTLFLDVDALVRKDWKRLGIINVYGNPSREKIVSSSIKQICSSVRNAWRADIRDSCLGSKTVCLAQFTFESASKYKTGGPGKDLSAMYSVHNALLRRFTYENPALVDRVEGEPDDDDAPNPRDKETRKRKKTAVARVNKGEDYWSCVDSWFMGLITAWGADIGSGDWKQCALGAY
ncbi:hypothetical protein JB92DRAFT_3107412 [Gautieria morchelliformis]|nr:hypothetical protein JB92DRAFT_3107412 [Gautieria morchelliformis]